MFEYILIFQISVGFTVSMRVPNEVKKCVAFICRITNVNGVDTVQPIGTGFFVSIPTTSPEIPNGQHTYLVTAKHVTAALGNGRFAVRVNQREGGVMHLLGENMGWVDHPDHSNNPADLTLIPFANITEYDAKTIPTSMFLSEESFMDGQDGIGIGDEVFFTGLFSHLAGEEKNLPIVRVGNLAMIPEQKVPTTGPFGNMDAYLIEARSLGGISGSPVFVRQTVQFGPSPFHLAGIMHGHWDIPVGSENIVPQATVGTEDIAGLRGVNMGIAIVTPAKKILETLMRPDLQERRIEAERQVVEARVQAVNIPESTMPTN